MNLPAGLADKLYWRYVYAGGGVAHCFKKTRRGHFHSLCKTQFHLTWIGGQKVERPAAVLRCPECDTLEMKRRGWDESGPETV